MAAGAVAHSSENDGPIMNLCEDRLYFLVSLLGAAIAGRTTILPSERTQSGLIAAMKRFPNAVAHCDTDEGAAKARAAGMMSHFVQASWEKGIAFPEFDLAALGRSRIVMFTSGSTGEPEPWVRELSFFEAGAKANAACMTEGLVGVVGIVSTTPPYHMFGFELSVAVPMYEGGNVYSGRPFYPSDIAAALSLMPEPRILVSTPVHLRVLKESGISVPRVARVFSATAPLGLPLAEAIETTLKTDVREIFGTTETGSIGWRKRTLDKDFALLHGMTLEQRNGAPWLSAPHISPGVRLGDTLEETGAGRFRLAGRSNDIVNIAGKRMSLSGMNAILTGLEGVVDGAFVPPDDNDAGPVERMTAIVVAPGLSAEDICGELRSRLDAAFIPRRILRVDELPRNEAGKLPLAEFRKFATVLLGRQGKWEDTLRFSHDELFFEGHFPGNPIVPGAVLLGEACRLVARRIGNPEAIVDIVSARFPQSTVPDNECLLRMEWKGREELAAACIQDGRIVMKATLRVRDELDG